MLLTFRWAEVDVANDDAAFAAHAATELPLAEHLVLPQDQMPRVFADPGAASDIEAPVLLHSDVGPLSAQCSSCSPPPMPGPM